MLEVRNLSVRYPNGVQALRDVTLDVDAGQIVGILGPSGAGKSTLVKGILGLVHAQGSVRFDGKSLKEWSKKTAYVEQKENIDRDFPISAFDCIMLGIYPHLGLFKRPGTKEKDRVRRALESVGLAALAHRQIGELSGGQFQRVLIARALVQQPTLLFLDEPFVGLDVENEATVVRLLQELRRQGTTVFVVHHDLSTVREYFDHVIFVHQDLIAAGPVEITYTDENIAKAFRIPQGVSSTAPTASQHTSWIKSYGHRAVRS